MKDVMMKIEKKETVDEPDLNILLKEKREYLVLYTTTSWRRRSKEAKEKEKFCPKESFVCVIVTLLVFGFTDGVFLADGPDKN